MLELRPSGECCDRDLPPDSADGVLAGRCPNGGRSFSTRPIRPRDRLARLPAAAARTHNPAGCARV